MITSVQRKVHDCRISKVEASTVEIIFHVYERLAGAGNWDIQPIKSLRTTGPRKEKQGVTRKSIFKFLLALLFQLVLFCVTLDKQR